MEKVWLRKKYYQKLEEEKRVVANEIHDTLGAFIVPLKSFISEGGSFESAEEKERWTTKLVDYQDLMSFTNSKIFPVQIQSGDVYTAIEGLSDQFSISDLTIDVTLNDTGPVADDKCIHIYRIIQESLVNSIKHNSPDYIQIVVDVLGADLFIDLMYKTTVENENWHRKEGRGQVIIQERLLIVDGIRKININKGFAVEEFIFKQALNECSSS